MLSPGDHFFLLKNRAMGDAIIGLGALQYLRELYPKMRLSYGVPEWVAPLFQNVVTVADEIVPLDFKNASGWWNTHKKIRKLAPGAVHEMFQSGRSAKYFRSMSFFSPWSYTFHNHHEKNGPVVDQDKILSNIQRDLNGVFTFYGIGEKPDFLDYCPTMKPREQRGKSTELILGIVATRQTKMWPLSYVHRFCHLFCEKYPENTILIPLSPSETDQGLKQKLQTLGLPEQICFVEETLGNLPLRLAGCMGYIGNDTGIKHLAIALGMKSLTLFGPEPPLEWHPYNQDDHPYLYKEGLECRTLTAHYCGLSNCDSMICLNQFYPENVLEKVEKLFKLGE